MLTNLVTGAHELSLKEEMLLYPNPASEIVTIKVAKPLQDVRLELYNMNGQLIELKEIPFLEQEEFDISHLTIGVYFIRLQSGIKTKTLKLIKNQ